MTFPAIGALTNSALYLALLGLAGIFCGSNLVVTLAIASAGVAYLDYARQYYRVGQWSAAVLTMASNVLGAAAGVALLMKYWG